MTHITSFQIPCNWICIAFASFYKIMRFWLATIFARVLTTLVCTISWIEGKYINISRTVNCKFQVMRHYPLIVVTIWALKFNPF